MRPTSSFLRRARHRSAAGEPGHRVFPPRYDPGVAAGVLYDAGHHYGLPREGRGAVAGLGRRFGAWAVDVALVAVAVAGPARLALVVWGVNNVLLPWLTGVTAGKRLFGLRVYAVGDGRVRTEQRGLSFPSAAGRGIAFGLLPLQPVLFVLTRDRDGRPLYDTLCATIVLEGR